MRLFSRKPASEEPDWTTLDPHVLDIELRLRHGAVTTADICTLGYRARRDPALRPLLVRLLAAYERRFGDIVRRDDTPRATLVHSEKQRSFLLRRLGFAPHAHLGWTYFDAAPPFGPEDREVIDRALELAGRSEDFLRSSQRSAIVADMAGTLTNVLQWGLHADEMPQWMRESLLARIQAAERQYEIAERQGASVTYFVGMLMGLLPAAALGLLTAWLLSLAGDRTFTRHDFLTAFVFGATGALVSATIRLSHGSLGLAPELGSGWVRLLATVRPILGGVFGALTYLILASGLMAVTVRGGSSSAFMAYAVIAFLAGFSERFAHDMLGATANKIAPGHGADFQYADQGEPLPPPDTIQLTLDAERDTDTPAVPPTD